MSVDTKNAIKAAVTSVILLFIGISCHPIVFPNGLGIDSLIFGVNRKSDSKRYNKDGFAIEVRPCEKCKESSGESLFLFNNELSNNQPKPFKTLNIVEKYLFKNDLVFLISGETNVDTCSKLYQVLALGPYRKIVDLNPIGINFQMCRKEICENGLCKRVVSSDCKHENFLYMQTVGTCDQDPTITRYKDGLTLKFKDNRFAQPSNLEYVYKDRHLSRFTTWDSKFGDLRVVESTDDDTASLIVHGNKITIPEEYFRSIDLAEKYYFGESEIFLFQFSGGGKCEGGYRFLNIGPKGYHLSDATDTCNRFSKMSKYRVGKREYISLEIPEIDGVVKKYVYDGEKLAEKY